MDTSKFSSFDSQRHVMFTGPAQIERDINVLMGIITGIVSDKEINDLEKTNLNNWIDSMAAHIGRDPYDSIINTVKLAIEDSIITEDEKQNIIWLCSKFINEKPFFNAITRDLQKLSGLLQGIASDKVINEQEVFYLEQWLGEHEHLKNCWPYDEVASFLNSILADGIVTKEESDSLLWLCNALTASDDDSNTAIVDLLNTGYFQVDPTIILQEKTFCITGLSKKYKRKEIAEMIELYGGYACTNISKQVNYLVVCDEKNSCWAYNCYGRKIEETIELRKKGHPIAIIHELDLYDHLESLK